MKKHIAMKWVKALRSGKYKKDGGRLKTENGYCCLGVLCEILESPSKPSSPDSNRYIFENVYEMYLPYKIQKLAGLKTNNGTHPKIISLAHLNDKKAKTFHMVANFIEKHWEEL